jgi:hypothetical protein
MARIRSIHPGFWTDDAVMELTVTAPLAIPLLLGLWNEADDQGVFVAKAVTLKARILPAVTVAVEPLLDLLESLNFIRRFAHAGKQYGAIRNFRKYQRPKSPQATHPLPRDARAYVGLDPAKPEIRGSDGGGVSEIDGDEVLSFPPEGEIPPQREEEGRRREEEGRRRKEITSSLRSEAPKLAPDEPPDARKVLWSEGLSRLRRITGKPDGAARSLLGRWCKAAGDDCALVSSLLFEAERDRPGEPIAWVEAAIQSRTGRRSGEQSRLAWMFNNPQQGEPS